MAFPVITVANYDPDIVVKLLDTGVIWALTELIPDTFF
jgi:hypothetical protein